MSEKEAVRLFRRKEEAFRRGFSAYLAEKMETDNPFPLGSEERSSWVAGYLGARHRAGKRSLVTAIEELAGHLDIASLAPDSVPDLVHLTKGEIRALVEAAQFVAALPWWARLLRKLTPTPAHGDGAGGTAGEAR